MSDLDLIYGQKKPSPPQLPPEEKPQPQILTSKQVSKKESNQVSKQEKNQESIEERILVSLRSTDLKINTFRYTQDELAFIRDIAYQADVKYNTKLNKNDIARIGLEWLMDDWKVNKDSSLLARILTSKQERK
jgi:hypothetical protein